MVAAFALLIVLAGCRCEDRLRECRLELVGGDAGAVRWWPLPCVVELPPQAWPAGTRLAVFGENGAELPAMVEPWIARPDGSIAWARVRFGELPRGARRIRLQPVRYSAPTTGVVVEAGPQGEFCRTAGGAAGLAVTGGRIALETRGARLELALTTNTLAFDGEPRTCGRSVQRRREGPDVAGVRWFGALETAPQAAGADRGPDPVVAWALDVAPSLTGATLRLQVQPNQDAVLRRWSIAGTLSGETPRLVRGVHEIRVAPDGTRATAALPASSPAAGDPFPADAPLSISVGQGTASITLGWPDFGVARPSASTLGADGRFELALVADPLLVKAGQIVERELTLATGSVGAVRARPVVIAARAPAGTPEAPDAVDWLASWRDWIRAWLARPQRLEDRGCYLESWGVQANGEYDLAGSALRLGIELRDGDWLEIGRTLARHGLAFDLARVPPDGWPPGLFFQHGDDHASGRIELGHQWCGGLVELAAVTGDLAAADAARAFGQALIAARSDPRRWQGPERRLAWPLLAAAELATRFGEPSLVELSRALAHELVGRQARAGYIDGDRRAGPAGEHCWVNCWVSLGITVPALARAAPFAPDAPDAARRLAQFIMSQGWRDGALAEVLRVDPASGAVIERQGRCRRGDAALAATGLEWLAANAPGGAMRGGAMNAKAKEQAAALWQRARADLAFPCEEDLVAFAKVARALVVRGQSLSSPSSSRRDRP